MSEAPFERTFHHACELCFLAEAPALARVGRRFEELAAASPIGSPTSEPNDAWRRLARRLQESSGLVAHGESSSTWLELRASLANEFGEVLSQAEAGVAGPVQEYFATGQMPPDEYLEWLLHSVETRRAASGDESVDWEVFQARADRLAQKLVASGYETSRDRDLRAADPSGYASRAELTYGMFQALQADDQERQRELAARQLEQLQSSPFLAQMQAAAQQALARFDANPQAPPELQEQLQNYLEQMRVLAHDPAEHVRNLMDQTAALPHVGLQASEAGDAANFPGDFADAAAPAAPLLAPPGQFLFRCGERQRIDAAQRRQFEHFRANQESLQREIEAALRELHEAQRPEPGRSNVGWEAYFSDDAAESELPLDCFRVESISLDPRHDGQVVVHLESCFPHFAEHGCALIVRDGRLKHFGTWDEVG